jgi:hypothetical protein
MRFETIAVQTKMEPLKKIRIVVFSDRQLNIIDTVSLNDVNITAVKIAGDFHRQEFQTSKKTEINTIREH